MNVDKFIENIKNKEINTYFQKNLLAVNPFKSHKIENIEVICGFSNFPEGKFINRNWYSLFRKTNEGGVNINNVMVNK